MGEIRSKKYSNSVDYIVISFSLNIMGQNCSVIFISWFGFLFIVSYIKCIFLNSLSLCYTYLLNECYQSAVTNLWVLQLENVERLKKVQKKLWKAKALEKQTWEAKSKGIYFCWVFEKAGWLILVISDHIEDFFMQKVQNSYFLFLFRMRILRAESRTLISDLWTSERTGGKEGGEVTIELFFKDSQFYFILLNTKYKKYDDFYGGKCLPLRRWPLSLKGLRTTDFEYSTGMWVWHKLNFLAIRIIHWQTLII